MKKEEFYRALNEKSLSISDEQKKQFDEYFHLLVEKNKVMNLTAIVEEEEVYEKHFYDCLVSSFTLDLNHKTWVDVGTGAGFPGIVLAIMYPTLAMTLVEPLHKRCVFLEEVKQKLGLDNVTIINQRAEDYVKLHREQFDYASARAVAKLNILLEIIVPLLKIQGTFIALKGNRGEEELLEAKNALKEVSCEVLLIERYILPTHQEDRMNLHIKKMKSSKLIYPRTYAKIVKRPL